MRLPRSTFYDAPSLAVDDAEIVGRMQAICDEFETYGYRRVGAALRQQGVVVNAKKVRRLMREHDLQPRRRRRFVATTDSAHDLPVFPNLAPEVVPDGPNQLWAGDITYVAVAAGVRLRRADPGRLVAPRGRLCDRSLHRGATRPGRARGRDRLAAATVGLHLPHGPGIAVRVGALPRAAQQARTGWLDEPPRQPVRQRQGGELDQGPSRLRRSTWPTTRRSRTSAPTCRGSSRRCTTPQTALCARPI